MTCCHRAKLVYMAALLAGVLLVIAARLPSIAALAMGCVLAWSAHSWMPRHRGISHTSGHTGTSYSCCTEAATFTGTFFVVLPVGLLIIYQMSWRWWAVWGISIVLILGLWLRDHHGIEQRDTHRGRELPE